MIIVIVPGRAPLTASVLPNDPTSYIVEISSPQTVSDVCITLSEPIMSVDAGIGIYWAPAPYINWEFLGHLSNDYPSDIVSTGWSIKSELFAEQPVRVGMKVESRYGLIERSNLRPPDATKMHYARKVALNLFRYIESFGGRTDQSVLDSWFRRFEDKLKWDPNFVLYTE